MLTEQSRATLNEPVPRLWREQFVIRSYEIGPSTFVTPQAVCRFLQEAASNHAYRLSLSTRELDRLNQMWVLSHLTLKMTNYPKWRDTLHIETWPVSPGTGIRAYRDFILRNDQGEELGRASTMWLLLNRDSRRPTRLPGWLSELTSPAISPAFMKEVKDSDFPLSAQATQTFPVRANEIDWNLHVNNVCYVEWALEALQPLDRLHQKVVELNIEFVGEAKLGDTILSELFILNNETSLHKICDQHSGKTIARIRMCKKPK